MFCLCSIYYNYEDGDYDDYGDNDDGEAHDDDDDEEDDDDDMAGPGASVSWCCAGLADISGG